MASSSTAGSVAECSLPLRQPAGSRLQHPARAPESTGGPPLDVRSGRESAAPVVRTHASAALRVAADGPCRGAAAGRRRARLGVPCVLMFLALAACAAASATGAPRQLSAPLRPPSARAAAAEADARSAVATSRGRNGTALTLLAVLLQQRGAYSEARDAAAGAARLDGANARALDVLASCAAALGDIDGAIAAFERAVDAAPDDGVALAKLGSMLLFAGRYEEAIETLERSLEFDPMFMPPRFDVMEA